MSESVIKVFCLLAGFVFVFLAMSTPEMIWHGFHRFDILLGKHYPEPWFVKYSPFNLFFTWLSGFFQ